jgi:flagellar hook-basal body complex protein FliE
MLPIGSVNSAPAAFQPGQIAPFGKPSAIPADLPSTQAPSSTGFAQMLEGLVNTVDVKQVQADAITNKVLLGDSGQLHQSVIAMQEATTALSLMVQVRNKLVDSYQELMRMQV